VLTREAVRLLGRPAPELRFTVGLTSMTSRERSGRPGAGKTDPVDAVAITRITAREPNLPAVRLAVGQAADLRALADYRAQLVAERTALANRTHTELHGLLPGYQAEIPRLTAPTFIAAAKAGSPLRAACRRS
jgi:transposase